MKIDISDWKEFKICELFKVDLALGDLKIDSCDQGKIPLVSSGKTNNGIVGYISENGDGISRIFTGNKITVDMFCNAFYQPEDFFAVSHGRINILTPLFEMNYKTGLFIASIINQEQFKFSYGRAVYSDEISRMVIKLPAINIDKDNYVPDFYQMEKFLECLHHKQISTKILSNSLALHENKIWKEFLIKDLFYILNGKGITKEEIDENPGDLYAIQSGEDNNGVIGKINKDYCIEAGYTYTDIPCLTVARTGSAGFISFQNFGCVVGDSAKILILKIEEKRNPYIYLFLKTILMSNKYKYTYGRKVTEEKYLNEVIKLPSKFIDNKYVPDWDFMEMYIRSTPYGDRI